MEKELSRFPRQLGEYYNIPLIEKLYQWTNSTAADLIVYLANNQMKNLFGENWFSIKDFCETMGYDRSKLQRKLTKENLEKIFGRRSPEYIRTEADGTEVRHPIETVFEAALYRLGIENMAFPVQNEDGSTSYNFVQIITRFDIKTNFNTKKGTKRLYTATLNPAIKDSLFTQYNLVELQEYRVIPDRPGYRYFYLNLSKMIYLIKYKIMKKQAPYFTLTVDQLAKMFDTNCAANDEKKRKVTKILNTINNLLTVSKFQYQYIKGKNERWAYTVQFYFPEDTLKYFDEKFTAVFTGRFYNSLLWKYVELAYPKSSGIGGVSFKIEEIKSNSELYNDYLAWAHSKENISIKEAIYRKTFLDVFGKNPEDLGLEIFDFSVEF